MILFPVFPDQEIMLLSYFALLLFQKSCGLQEKYCHDHRRHIADHKGIHFFTLKYVTAGFHFFLYPFWLDNP